MCYRRCLKVFKVMSFQYRINTNHSISIIHLFSLSLCCNIVLMYKTADYHITFCHCMWVICHPLQHVSPQWQLDNDPKVNLTGHQQPHSPLSHCTPSTVESIAYYYLHEVKLTATQWVILTNTHCIYLFHKMQKISIGPTDSECTLLHICKKCSCL